MTKSQARRSAREILRVVPLVMRRLAAALRVVGELPAPAHFGLMTIMIERPRTLSQLAALQGVSLPTMSNSISALVERGWVRRTAPATDRRIVMIEVTPAGRATVQRAGRAAETQLSRMLSPFDGDAGRYLQAGLEVMRAVFGTARPSNGRATSRRERRQRRTKPQPPIGRI
jgi:DNA-binding MarR family transcriptional regulator